MNTFANAIVNAENTTTTDNGHICYKSTLNSCLDLFGRAGAMRESSIKNKQTLFKNAYNEDPDLAMKILFYLRDIRGGCGERDTFIDMVRWVAEYHPESIKKNLFGFMEYGRAKDLYALIDTPVEEDMWAYMKQVWEEDLTALDEGRPVSLLAKWIATPDASSERTRRLGRLTANKLGYDNKHAMEYRKKLRELRKHINITERLMASNNWDQIDYSKVPSQCMLKNSYAFKRHDLERFTQFREDCMNGMAKINTSTVMPCQILRNMNFNNLSNEMADTMWKNLPDYCTSDAFVIADVSGSMISSLDSMAPIYVSIAMAIYFAERNKGDLKDYFMTFSENPQMIHIHPNDSLIEKYETVLNSEWGSTTDMKAAFMKMLQYCIKNKVQREDMPKAFIVISDMQIDEAFNQESYLDKQLRLIENYNKLSNDDALSDEDAYDVESGELKFFQSMKKLYAENGYEIPHVVFWNVNATKATFHAASSDRGVTLVSGFSPAIFLNVMNCIGKTPLESMMAIVDTERYAPILA